MNENIIIKPDGGHVYIDENTEKNFIINSYNFTEEEALQYLKEKQLNDIDQDLYNILKEKFKTLDHEDILIKLCIKTGLWESL